VATEDDAALWRARGQEVCRAVYGGQYPRLRENVRDLHPDMERWMVEEGYGKVLGRP
jgi:4-carboxymuconolactone decarboxylase